MLKTQNKAIRNVLCLRWLSGVGISGIRCPLSLCSNALAGGVTDEETHTRQAALCNEWPVFRCSRSLREDWTLPWDTDVMLTKPSREHTTTHTPGHANLHNNSHFPLFSCLIALQKSPTYSLQELYNICTVHWVKYPEPSPHVFMAVSLHQIEKIEEDLCTDLKTILQTPACHIFNRQK